MGGVRRAGWGSASKQACCNQGTTSRQAGCPKGKEQSFLYSRATEGSRQQQEWRSATGRCSSSSIRLHTLDQGAASPCIVHYQGSLAEYLPEQQNHLSLGSSAAAIMH